MTSSILWVQRQLVPRQARLRARARRRRLCMCAGGGQRPTPATGTSTRATPVAARRHNPHGVPSWRTKSWCWSRWTSCRRRPPSGLLHETDLRPGTDLRLETVATSSNARATRTRWCLLPGTLTGGAVGGAPRQTRSWTCSVIRGATALNLHGGRCCLTCCAQKIVRLNVGGTIFATSRETLTRDEYCMLTVLVNGDMPSTRDTSGAFFIGAWCFVCMPFAGTMLSVGTTDRDPEHFRYILNYLRDGVSPRALACPARACTV